MPDIEHDLIDTLNSYEFFLVFYIPELRISLQVV